MSTSQEVTATMQSLRNPEKVHASPAYSDEQFNPQGPTLLDPRQIPSADTNLHSSAVTNSVQQVEHHGVSSSTPLHSELSRTSRPILSGHSGQLLEPVERDTSRMESSRSFTRSFGLKNDPHAQSHSPSMIRAEDGTLVFRHFDMPLVGARANSTTDRYIDPRYLAMRASMQLPFLDQMRRPAFETSSGYETGHTACPPSSHSPYKYGMTSGLPMRTRANLLYEVDDGQPILPVPDQEARSTHPIRTQPVHENYLGDLHTARGGRTCVQPTWTYMPYHCASLSKRSVRPQPEIQETQITNANTSSQSTSPVQHGALKGEYRDYLHDAPGAETALPKCFIGAIELCTFFPNHTQWPNVLIRLRRNGWSTKQIAHVQLFARGRDHRDAIRKRDQALRHQITKAGKDYFGNPKFLASKQPEMRSVVEDLDASLWQPSELISRRLLRGYSRGLEDVPLINCAQGVINWPQGNDVGLVTQCILLAVQTNDHSMRISDIPYVAQSSRFMLPQEGRSCVQWDGNALTRFTRIVEGSRLV